MRKTRKQLQIRYYHLLSKGILLRREEVEIKSIQQRLRKSPMSDDELYNWAVNYIAQIKGDRVINDRLLL